MKEEYFFKVAGFLFSVVLPRGWNVEELLPSFRPFRCAGCTGSRLLFRLLVTTQPLASDAEPAELLNESCNDLGHVCLLRHLGGYRVEVDYGNADWVHVMTTEFCFDNGTAFLHSEDPFVGTVLSSMLRILFAQAVLGRDGVSIHASCVALKGKSYLFLGKSGTGKSTHARQWMEAFPDSSLLNDDNPVLRMKDGRVMAYGTPWSGKTPCYKSERYPVAGIVRLQQAKANRFTSLIETDTFAALLPSCSVIRQDARLQDALYRTLIQIAEHVPVGQMECLPTREAAWLCFESLYVSNSKTLL